jgi:hypothetical protein
VLEGLGESLVGTYVALDTSSSASSVPEFAGPVSSGVVATGSPVLSGVVSVMSSGSVVGVSSTSVGLGGTGMSLGTFVVGLGSGSMFLVVLLVDVVPVLGDGLHLLLVTGLSSLVVSLSDGLEVSDDVLLGSGVASGSSLVSTGVTVVLSGVVSVLSGFVSVLSHGMVVSTGHLGVVVFLGDLLGATLGGLLLLVPDVSLVDGSDRGFELSAPPLASVHGESSTSLVFVAVGLDGLVGVESTLEVVTSETIMVLELLVDSGLGGNSKGSNESNLSEHYWGVLLL